MKVAIASDGGVVSPHFGRCAEYHIAEISNGMAVNRKVVANPGHEPGALPRFLHSLGVECAVAGGAGPRAIELMSEYGIELLLGVAGTVDETLGRLARGELQPGQSTCDH